MTKDEALKMAIEALEMHVPHYIKDRGCEAIKACKEALAQPTAEQSSLVQEAMIIKQENGMVLKLGYDELPNGTAFYTTPSREWQSLSDAEINLIYPCTGGEHDFKDIARAIEAKLKEKNEK